MWIKKKGNKKKKRKNFEKRDPFYRGYTNLSAIAAKDYFWYALHRGERGEKNKNKNKKELNTTARLFDARASFFRSSICIQVISLTQYHRR